MTKRFSTATVHPKSHTGLYLTAFLSVASCLCAFNSHATTIYKSIDENGNVFYTDQPLEGATALNNNNPNNAAPSNQRSEALDDAQEEAQQDARDRDLSNDRVAIAPNPNNQPKTAPVEEEIVYPPVSRVDIINPQNDALLLNPVGKIWVELQSSPSNLKESLLTAQLWMNGAMVNSGKRPMLALPIPERGSHMIQIKLVDHKNRLRMESDVVEFHVKFDIAETSE